MKRFLTALSIMLAMLPVALRADIVEGLYEAEVALVDGVDFDRAARVALAEVLVRVSGSRRVSESLTLGSDSAKQMIKQYRYQQRESEQGDVRVVHISFDEQLVNGVLRKSGQPIWSANRPAVLVWVVLDDQQGRRFATAETAPELVAAITSVAAERGIPVRFPLLDLVDYSQVTLDDLWQLRTDMLLASAQRYQAEEIVAGRVTHLSSGVWWGDWRWLSEGEEQGVSAQSHDPVEYVATLFDPLADQLAERFAVLPVRLSESGVLMQLRGLQNFSDYARATNYLEGLASVEHANLVSLEGDQAVVRLLVEGELEQLREAIALDRQLTPLNEPLDNPSILLNYQWSGR